MRIDDVAERIHLQGRPPLTLSFAGLPPEVPAAARPARQAARDRAYALLREASQQLATGYGREAPARLEEAVAAARASEDPIVLDWASRSQVRALVVLGDPRAEAAALALHQRTHAPVDVAYETAEGLHLRGELARAVEWYRRGFARDPVENSGRFRRELLVGLVLAHAELGHFDEALADMERFRPRLLGDADIFPALAATLAWRRGERPSERVPLESWTDLLHYWHLEQQLARGARRADLLAEARAQAQRSSGLQPLFQSLEAELLRLVGAATDAERLSSEAYPAAERAAATMVAVRAHLQLVAERRAAALRGVGAAEEAAHVLRRAHSALVRRAVGDPPPANAE